VPAGSTLQPLIGSTSVITVGDDVVTIPGGGAGFSLWSIDSPLS